MTPIKYYDMTRAKDHKFSLRLEMAIYANTHGIRAAARAFQCSRNTVRRWLRRFQEGGRAALQDRSRAPKSCPHKLHPSLEKKILQARRQLPCAGPQRIRDLFGIEASLGAIARVLRQHGLTRKRHKKYQRKNDLRAAKALYNAFERIQADTKHLQDIPFFWPQMKTHKLPRYQYTVRDVKSGALFLDFADELSTTYALMATQRIAYHLQAFGIDLTQSILSTDNGAEYGGTDRHEREYGFHSRIQQTGITHRFLPPATPNSHADVESSHRWIEDEFFDLESFYSKTDFFLKAFSYQLWWNFGRPNYSKGGKTPARILQEQDLDPRLLLLPPTDLDQLFRLTYLPHRVGPHVPGLSVKSEISQSLML